MTAKTNFKIAQLTAPKNIYKYLNNVLHEIDKIMKIIHLFMKDFK